MFCWCDLPVNRLPCFRCGLYKVFSDKLKIVFSCAMINIVKFHFAPAVSCASLAKGYFQATVGIYWKLFSLGKSFSVSYFVTSIALQTSGAMAVFMVDLLTLLEQTKRPCTIAVTTWGFFMTQWKISEKQWKISEKPATLQCLLVLCYLIRKHKITKLLSL